MPAQVHLRWPERGQVPVEHRPHPPPGVEDEVAQAHVPPQHDGRSLGRSMAGTPLERLDQRGQGLTLRRPGHVARPAVERSREPRARQVLLQRGPPPGHAVHRGQHVDETVVHHALERGPGVADVGVEERRRAGDVPGHPWHDEERRADVARVGDDDGRGGGRHPRVRRGVLHHRLRRQVVVGERGLEGREPHHEAGTRGAEVDQNRLVRPAALGVRQRREARRAVLVGRLPRHVLGVVRHPTFEPRCGAPRRRVDRR